MAEQKEEKPKKKDTHLRWVSQKYPDMKLEENFKKENAAVPAFRTISMDDVRIRQHVEVEDTLMTKFFRRNPLIPLGMGLTVGALVFGMRSMLRGDRKMSQYMMRLRVGAQGFTIAAIVVGSIYLKSQLPEPEEQRKN